MIDFNPHPVRRADLDCPDELRVDLDPQPGVRWNTVRQVAMCVKEVLEDHGLRGFPKTSGSRGIHVNVRIEPEWDYVEVRRAALALAREVERRVPKKATSKWWKEERHGVFVDYNQNARDRTIASGYSVRPVPDARVCCPIGWKEVPDVEPGELRLDTVPARLKKKGDPAADIDKHAGSLDKLLDLARRDEEEGLGDAPWPPHFRKQRGEPKRVQPSKAKKKPLGQLGRQRLRPIRVEEREVLSLISSVLAASFGAPTISHSCSSSVSLNSWRVCSGSTNGVEAAEREHLIVDPKAAGPLQQHVELGLSRCRCLVDAWPGRSRHSRAPIVLASSCLARSVFSTFIWFEGRQWASAARNNR